MRRRLPFLLVAVLIVAAGAFLLLRRPPAPGSPVGEAPVLLPVAPVGLLTKPPAEIRWREVKGATDYDVEILDQNRRTIWKGSATTGSIPFPSELAPRLDAREMLYYRIRARSGLLKREIAISEPVFFRMSGRP
jgi:hypothetical protein